MKLHYIKITFSLAIASFLMAGCLKDQPYEDQEIQSNRPKGNPRVIEMKIAATNTENFLSVAYNNGNNDTVVDLVPIHLATADVAGEDINVTVELKPDLVDAYNQANHTEYEVPVSSLISIVNPVVTIPRGSRTGFLQVKFRPSSIIGHEYALGLAIKSVDKANYTISGNLGSGVIAMLIKNKYDGKYKVDGTLVDLVDGSLSSTPGDPYPFEVELRTVGANSVVMWEPRNGYYHLIGTGSVYGEFAPVFTFDPATNKVISVTNDYGQPSPSRARSAEIDPSGANVQNADKSIDVKYVMKQGGGTRTTFDEHFTYLGPR
ncbi:DUF1735 domain-containing protein [Longitalea arenae]|uniref:DUF1735 domain-containing protein n=1 Tax=Longitalea arenae TaxID=2812558 RepID=UPI001968444F|nr:DUF1735 domain-containing protein [Longitalea arenae]